MKVTEITASFGRTIQFQQYEPVNVHVSLKAEVEEYDEDAFNRLNDLCQETVNKRIEVLETSRAEIEASLFADEIPALLVEIGACNTRKERIKVWENTNVSLRRIAEVKKAFFEKQSDNN